MVRPGDLLLGDEDGVVVVPVERAEAVAGQVLQRLEREAERMAAIRRGVISPAWLDETMQRVGTVHT